MSLLIGIESVQKTKSSEYLNNCKFEPGDYHGNNLRYGFLHLPTVIICDYKFKLSPLYSK